MRFRRFLSVSIISLFLVGTMVLAGGCGLLPSVGEMLGFVSDVVEEEAPGDTETEPQEQSDEEESDESEPDDSEPDEDPESEGSESDGQPELNVDDWYNPRSVSDLVDNFERFEWTWARVSDGEEGDPHRVTYQIEGTEQVEGVDATRIALTFEEDEVLLWLDDDREVVRARVNDDVVPEMALDTMLAPMLEGAFAPFVALDEMDVEGLMQGTDESGADWRIIDESTETIGEMQAEVTTVEVEIGTPWVDEGDEVQARWEIADFGDFQMLVAWKGEKGASQEEHGMTLEVENLTPR